MQAVRGKAACSALLGVQNTSTKSLAGRLATPRAHQQVFYAHETTRFVLRMAAADLPRPPSTSAVRLNLDAGEAATILSYTELSCACCAPNAHAI